MIERDTIQSWFAWLCSTWPTNEEPELVIAPPEYDSIGYDEDNPVAFGVFIPDMNRIIVLSRLPEELRDDEERFLFTSLAHEYRHHLQWMNGATAFEEFKERDAETFADEAWERREGIQK